LKRRPAGRRLLFLPRRQGSDLVFQADGKLLAGGFTPGSPYYQNSDFALARYLDNSAAPAPTPSLGPKRKPGSRDR
jgi:hypothetical protein